MSGGMVCGQNVRWTSYFSLFGLGDRESFSFSGILLREESGTPSIADMSSRSLVRLNRLKSTSRLVPDFLDQSKLTLLFMHLMQMSGHLY